MTPMTTPLHQITMTYSPEQDRILLRIATTDQSEYQLWLPRRFIKVLWAALLKTLERDPELRKNLLPEVRNAVMGMNHQEAVQTSDFSQKHSEDYRNLTSNTGPLLVTGGSVTPAGKDLTQLTLQTEQGTAINVALNKQLMHAFCHLIISSAHKAEWDIDMAVGDGNVVVPTEQTALH